MAIKYCLSETAQAVGCKFAAPRVGDSGYDICASESCVLINRTQVLVPTGLYLAIPEGFVGLIRDRSSMAMRGLFVNAGVIDPGFRGEVRVLMESRTVEGGKNYVIDAGQRIAQIVIVPTRTDCPLKERAIADLGFTVRGSGSFGSTGA